MRHHRLAWRVERSGWVVMALLVVATLLGAFGDGPLSRATAGSPAALAVSYDRLQRSGAPTAYRLRVHPSLARAGTLTLRFDRSLVDGAELESVVPEPRGMRAGSGHVEFTFDVAPGASPFAIDMRFRPTTFGRRRGWVSVEGGTPLPLDQFVYP